MEDEVHDWRIDKFFQPLKDEYIKQRKRDLITRQKQIRAGLIEGPNHLPDLVWETMFHYIWGYPPCNINWPQPARITNEEIKQLKDNNMKTLTRVPSELIRIAVRDMKAVIAAGGTIHMNTWGTGVRDRKSLDGCEMCMAGSVLAMTACKKLDPHQFSAGMFGNNRDQVQFLDNIRKGKLAKAMRKLGIDCTNNSNKYQDGWANKIKGWKRWSATKPKKFYKQCNELACYLEGLGM